VDHADFLEPYDVRYGDVGREDTMGKPTSTMAQQIAQAAGAFHRRRTGHSPKSVAVVLGEDTLVITLHEALSPAEKNLAKTSDAAAQVQEFHRQLFANDSDSLRQEIKRITGVEVREAVADVETTTGSVMQIFTTGTMVQVFRFAHGVPSDTWGGGEMVQLKDPISQYRSLR
jgi:uncharacterized protein YbcI